LLKKAIKENKFTGSTYLVDVLKDNKKNGTQIMRQQTQSRVIDGMFCTREDMRGCPGLPGEFSSKIISLNEIIADYKYALSDHLGCFGIFIHKPVNKGHKQDEKTTVVATKNGATK
jgi:hypothetical protein